MASSTVIRDEISEQFQRSFQMLQQVIEKIPEEQWQSGLGASFTPAVIAYHCVESIDFYFSGMDRFIWGYRFRGPWWEIDAEALPTRVEILLYLQEIQQKVTRYFVDCDDIDLLKSFELFIYNGINANNGESRVEKIINGKEQTQINIFHNGKIGCRFGDRSGFCLSTSYL